MSSDHIRQRLGDLAATATRAAEACLPDIERAAALVRSTVARGGTLFFCGNGGSAADAQHIATEYVVRYMKNRRALAAVALTTDTSLLTAAGNDFGFDHIFERQVQALVKPGDLLLIHSTSGNSPNVLLAAAAARAKGVPVVALSSRDGGKLRALADVNIVVPTDRTDRAQELHLCIQHLICELVESDIESDIQSDVKSDIESDIKSDVKSDIESDIKSDVKSDIESDIKSDIQSDIQSDIKA